MKVFLDYGQIKVILPVLALLIIYLRAFFIDKINQKLLLGLCGGLFAVFFVGVENPHLYHDVKQNYSEHLSFPLSPL